MVPFLLSPFQGLGLVGRPGPTSTYKKATRHVVLASVFLLAAVGKILV